MPFRFQLASRRNQPTVKLTRPAGSHGTVLVTGQPEDDNHRIQLPERLLLGGHQGRHVETLVGIEEPLPVRSQSVVFHQRLIDDEK